MDLYQSIITFKYIAIFIGSFIEGITVGLIVGFLARMHYINLYWGYLAHVFGDWSADIMYYAIGYFGGAKIVPKFARFLRYSVKDIENLEKVFKKHSTKFILFGKITHVIGFPLIIAAGLARYSWYRFVLLDFVAELIKGAILVFIGYHFGGFWEKVDNTLFVLSGIALLGIVGQVGFFFVKRFLKIRNGDIILDREEEERWIKKWGKK